MKDDQLMKQESKHKRFAELLSNTECAAQKVIRIYNNPSEVSEKKRGPHLKTLSTEYVLAVQDIVAINNKEDRQNTVKSTGSKPHEIYDLDISNAALFRDLYSIGLK